MKMTDAEARELREVADALQRFKPDVMEKIMAQGGKPAEFLKTRVAAMMNVLSKITAKLSGQPVVLTTDGLTQDAGGPTLAEVSADLYADAMAKEGRRQGSRACREPLAIDRTRWPSLGTMDSDSVSQAANEATHASRGYDDAKDYAQQMKECHRKGVV